MSEKRFPPPGNETGYREAASPLASPEPPPIDASRPHVLVTRPDDPEIARGKAALEDPEIRQQEARIRAREVAQRRATWLAVCFAALFVLLRTFACSSRHRLH